MSAYRYWVWDLRPDECAHHDWYQTKDDGWTMAPPYAVTRGDRIEFYIGSLDAEMWRLLLAAIAAPTEADVRGLK